MKKIYLTIDDAPSKDFKAKIDLLSSEKIPAIFFCIGSLIERKLDDIIWAIKKGFVIGNHSYSHPKFSDISIYEAKKQISKTDKLINKAYKEAGIKRPIKIFRFPHGDKGNEETKEIYQRFLKKIGYRQPNFEKVSYKWYKNKQLDDIDVYWTYNSKDYTVARYRSMGEKSPYGFSEPKVIYSRMNQNDPKNGRGLNYAKSNEIFLIHDNKLTSDIFRNVVKKLAKKNIQFCLPKLSL